MSKRARSPESKSLASHLEHPAAEAPESLADTLARIRREALERVTDQLSGRRLLLPRPLAAQEQQLLKEELARLARDGDTAMAVAAGAAPGEVCFVHCH